MKSSLYVRYGETIVSMQTTSSAPDALDELRVQVARAFEHAMSVVAWEVIDDDAGEGVDTPPDPATVDTTDLPPI